MKTHGPLLTLPILLFVLRAPAQQITNGGFEDWSDVFAYSDLQDWRTGNWQLPGLATTTQVPGPSGLYAAHLQTHIVDSDTAFGFIIHGDFLDDLPTEGILFATAVDAVEGWYRCDLVAGDSSVLIVGVWSGGILSSLDVHLFGGAQPAWTAFDLPVNGGVPIVPDSVVVAVASSNPFAPTGSADGSWIEVDAIQLTSTIVTTPDQLPNYDMELWADIITEEPDAWSTFNQELASLALTPVTKSILANSGSYSVRIETLDLGGDTLPGVVSNGEISFSGPTYGIPYTDMPTSLDGYFMYEPNGADTAIIFAQFTNAGVPVGTAVYGFGGSTPAWTAFSAPVTILSPPDTLLLVIFSGDSAGSALYLDDLSFAFGNVQVNELSPDPLMLHPNPATDQLSLTPGDQWSGGQWSVFDACGRMLPGNDRSIPDGSCTIPVAALAPGHYWLELRKGSEVRRLPFVKQ